MQITHLLHHRDLIHMLISRNLKIRYKGSALGFLWSLLTPLAMILIYSLFAGVLGLKRQLLGLSPEATFDYLPFLVTGIVVWQFTAGTLSDSLHAIAGNTNLVKKVYFPRAILPISTVLANAVNFLLTLAILLLYLALSGSLRLHAAYYLLPALALHLLLCHGISLLVATLNVFYRDTEHIIGLLLLAWFFTSPIMYEASLQTNALAAHLPAAIPTGILYLNPMSGILALYRAALMGMDLAPAGVPPAYLLLSVATTLLLTLAGHLALHHGDRFFGDVL